MARDIVAADDKEGAAEVDEAFGGELAEELTNAAEDDAPGGAPEQAGTSDDELAAGLEDEPEGEGTAEDEPEAAPEGREAQAITREDGAQWNEKAQRWQKDGGFVAGDPPAKAGAPEAGKATPVQGQPAAAAADASGAPSAIKWEPVVVRADRAQFEIPEARVTKVGEHFMFAVPEKQLNDFQRRLARGVLFEQRWQQLDQGIRDLDRQRKELAELPPRKSDLEVEAEILLAELKPHLTRILDEDQLEKLDLKVKLAQRDEKDRYAGELEKRKTQESEAEEAQRFQREGLANTVIEIVEQFPQEFGTLTDDDLKDVMRSDLMPVLRAIVFREGNDWYTNTQYIFDRLKMRAAARATATPATPAQPAGTPAAKAPDRAEQFNKGQDTAAQPRTTAVKAGRGQRPSAPAPTRPDASRRVPARTADQQSEDEWNNLTRNFMAAPGLDLGDD